jgi:hypothetical protein
MRGGAALAASIVLLLGLCSGVSAQEAPVPKRVPPSSAQKKVKPPQPPQPPQSQGLMPGAGKIVLLLRNTLITLNDAIQTGNFTVLRDRAAPGFRDANSAARLSQAFADLASRNIDLSSVAVISPQLTESPGLDEKAGMLRLKGYFPGQPVQINFEVLFQVVDGRWRLFGLSVQPAESRPEATPGNGAAAVPSKEIIPKKPPDEKPAQPPLIKGPQ